MTDTLEDFQECIIVVAYPPVRESHEPLILSGFDKHRPHGVVVESSFEKGGFTIYVDADGYPNEFAVREAVKLVVEEVFGEVAVTEARLSVAWEGTVTLPAIERPVSSV